MVDSAVKSVPILIVAKSLGLELAGRKARCFNTKSHQGKTDENPSLVFFPEYGRYKCYACGVGGDAIDLIRGVLKCGFREARSWLETLSDKAITRSVQSRETPCKVSRRPDERAQDVYAALYELTLEIQPGHPGGQYLEKRGIDLDLAVANHVTYIDDADQVWSELESSFDSESLNAAGLVSQAGNFLFARHHLLFFYFLDEWPVYIQARSLTRDSGPKELSLAGVTSPSPYNIDLLREPQSSVHVCEGCIDTLSALQLGLPACLVSRGPQGF